MQDKMEQQTQTKDISNRLDFDTDRDKDILTKVKEVLRK